MSANLDEYEFLKHLLDNLSRAKSTLEYSYGICNKIAAKDDFNEYESDRFESMTSKFARLADLILKRVIRAIAVMDLEEPPETMRDSINHAAKMDLVSSELKFIEIRKVRNKIAHDYVEEDDLKEIYRFVLENTPILFDAVDRIEKYCKKYKKTDDI